MTDQAPLSPRQEALDSILHVSAAMPDVAIDAETWNQLVGIAWAHRTNTGDRREVQRELREVLLEASRKGDADAAS